MIPPIANRFIAGETAQTAIANTQHYRDDGVYTILNRLGEHYDSPADAVADADEYCDLITDHIEAPNRICLSVKPSQLGIDIALDRDTSTFENQLERVVETAYDNDVFVWVDMEDSETTDATLDAVERLGRTYDSTVGVAIQANLRRTADDLRRLNGSGVAVRLVKGAYDEPNKIAYQDDTTIDEQYKSHLEYLFAEFDGYVAVATHDPAMIAQARNLATTYDREFEFQMLLGVRPNAQRELAAEGYDVWQYAPYGDEWMAYVWRRLREGKNNAGFILRALIGNLFG